MKIQLKQIPIRDLYDGYANNDEEGVYGYGGKLNIRPKYQREFIYKPEQQQAVINTVLKNFPLNTMYWVKSEDESESQYEVLDGQQRTLSICSYIHGDFALEYKYFNNLTIDEQYQILNYELMIYICEGTDSEKLDWFKIINIAGEKLTDQELRNAVYTGKWLSSAKKYFSKTSGPAYHVAEDYMKGRPIRQDYLEKVIQWIADRDNVKTIEEYMAIHQHDYNASELWLYFNQVINWVKAVFPVYRKEMKGLEWGLMYNEYGNGSYDSEELEKRTLELLGDEDVTKNRGIYEYLLSGDEKHLNLRAFNDKIKRMVYEKQKGVCVSCEKHFEYGRMEGDHIVPWSKGGKTEINNCQMLCKKCNNTKSSK